MKVAIVSQPKAGTYLCGNLLQCLGLEFAMIHAREHNYTKVHKKKEYQLKYLRKQKVKSPLDETVKLVDQNQYFVSHLECNEYTKNVLRPFKKILLLRDLESCVKSWEKWARVVNKSNETEMLDPDFRNNVKKWENQEGVFTMSFYDMKNKNHKVIDRLQHFLFDCVTVDSTLALHNALEMDSLTKVAR